MYSGTLKQTHVDFAALTHLVPDLRPEEMAIGRGVATVKKLPFEAPWMSAFGACLIMITSIRRAPEGYIEFQLGGKDAVPYENGNAWCRADDFYSEWPK